MNREPLREVTAKDVLYKFNVPDAERTKLLAMVDSVEKDIVASGHGG